MGNATRNATARHIIRFALAGTLLFAGIGHLTWGHRGAAVRAVRQGHGGARIWGGRNRVGAAIAIAPQPARKTLGAATAAFFVAVFPGNIAHWVSRRDVPGLDSDDKRFARLFLQPVLVAAALWATRRPRR